MADNVFKRFIEDIRNRRAERRLMKRINKFVQAKNEILKNQDLNPSDAYVLVEQYNDQMRRLFHDVISYKTNTNIDLPVKNSGISNSDISNSVKYFKKNNSNRAKKEKLNDRIDMYEMTKSLVQNNRRINEQEADDLIKYIDNNIKELENIRNENKLDLVNAFPTEDGRDILDNYNNYLSRNGVNPNTMQPYSPEEMAKMRQNQLPRRYRDRRINYAGNNPFINLLGQSRRETARHYAARRGNYTEDGIPVPQRVTSYYNKKNLAKAATVNRAYITPEKHQAILIDENGSILNTREELEENRRAMRQLAGMAQDYYIYPDVVNAKNNNAQPASAASNRSADDHNTNNVNSGPERVKDSQAKDKGKERAVSEEGSTGSRNFDKEITFGNSGTNYNYGRNFDPNEASTSSRGNNVKRDPNEAGPSSRGNNAIINSNNSAKSSRHNNKSTI